MVCFSKKEKKKLKYSYNSLSSVFQTIKNARWIDKYLVVLIKY